MVLAAYLVLLAVLGLALLLGAALLVRALIRTREAGPPAGWALALASLVLLAIPVVAAGTYFLLPAPVSDRGLTNSVERETGSTSYAESDCDEIACATPPGSSTEPSPCRIRCAQLTRSPGARQALP